VTSNLQLKKPVTVIVPIYNAFEELTQLLNILDRTLGYNSLNIRFVFANDASPDPKIARLLRTHRFVKRRYVTTFENKKNLGFVRTVNRCLQMRDQFDDILLLNSDVLLRGSSIKILQEVAHRYSIVGSVTPLTNNGTIASLFNWPSGGPHQLGLSYEETCEIVEGSRISTPTISAPVGVGFCMYITATALAAVGPLDAAAFKRGYGEEEDWCYRASAKGFIHLITPETYVEHKGTRSFSIEEKRQRIDKGQKILKERYPDYLSNFRRYIERDPMQSCRAGIILNLTAAALNRTKKKLATFVLHNDPEFFAGSIEATVRHQTKKFLEHDDVDVFQVFAVAQSENWAFRYYQSGSTKPGYTITVDQDQLFAPLAKILQASDLLHLHHWIRLPEIAKSVIKASKCGQKIATLHDYFALCDMPQLINSADRYCALPSDVKDCLKCAKNRGSASGTDEYRLEQALFLSTFDRILVPSEAARDVVRTGFGTAAQWMPDNKRLFHNLARRIDIYENPIFFAEHISSDVMNARAKSDAEVIFLGGLSPAKGAVLVERVADFLKEKQIRAEIWGATSSFNLNEDLPVRGYKSSNDLLALAAKKKNFIVAMPSIWPETFSYTLYEATLILRAPVVVGPFGNPARVVKKFGLGAVMKDATPAALKSAILEVRGKSAEYRENVERFRAAMLNEINEIRSKNILADLDVLKDPASGEKDLTVDSAFWFSQIIRMERRLIKLNRIPQFYAAHFSKATL
jgi:O-antigen biosynthesis protein